MANGNDNRIILIGRTNFRNHHKAFGIWQTDHLAHTYIVGKTNTGRSTMHQTMIRQDIEVGEISIL